MGEYLQDNEATVRTAVFFGLLVLLAILEIFAPRRDQQIGRRFRWPSNLGIVVLDSLLVRLVFPAAAVGAATLAAEQGWGLLNLVTTPEWCAILVSLIVLDLAIYGQHVLFHAVPFLWRIHRMHHADLEFDVTTGLRFHPIEILLSMAIKFAVVFALGPPVVAVLLFEVVLNATSMFNHSNLRLPLGLDRVLRWLVVTPDMHRVHHSIRRSETDSNFGFNLPWWDRLFRTYHAQPEDGHEGMTIGIERFRERSDLRLDRMLAQPFRGNSSTDSVDPN